MRIDAETALNWQLERLTSLQFDRSVRVRPDLALFNSDAFERLSIRQLDFCIRKLPTEALEHLAWLLTREQLAYCCIWAPREALQFAASSLTARQLLFCCRKAPWYAIASQSNGLSHQQWETSCRDMPSYALEMAVDRMGSELLDHCCRRAPGVALRYAVGRMSDARFGFCVRKDSWQALQSVPDRLKPEQLLRFAADHSFKIKELLAVEPNHALIRSLAPLLVDLDPVAQDAVAEAISRNV